MYCMILNRIAEARRGLEKTVSPLERRALQQILRDSEGMMFELAESVSLTPGSQRKQN